MKKLSIVLLILFCILPLSAQQKRSGGEVDGEVVIEDSRQTVTPQGKQWAVFIAIDQYRFFDPEDPLKHPVNDAKEIKAILLQYYEFDEAHVKTLYNEQANKEAIFKLFTDLKEQVKENDSVFVFHAGHGVGDDNTSAWIPYDGGGSSDKSNWISHYLVRSMLDSLPARHVFLISDSCFSGDLLSAKKRGQTPVAETTPTFAPQKVAAKTRGNPETVNYPTAYNNISRQVMTSGARQNVNDKSEFATRLKYTLENTERAFIDPDYLIAQIKFPDGNYFRSQPAKVELSTQPILEPMPESKHDSGAGGSFLFFRKNPRESSWEEPDSSKTGQDIKQATKKIEPGTAEFFIGSWTGYPEIDNDMSLDEYEITFMAGSRCKIKITNDTAQQETEGRWNFDGSSLKIDATFRNATISYQRKIEWLSLKVRYDSDTSFYMIGKASTNAAYGTGFTFYRNN